MAFKGKSRFVRQTLNSTQTSWVLVDRQLGTSSTGMLDMVLSPIPGQVGNRMAAAGQELIALIDMPIIELVTSTIGWEAS